MPRAKSTEPKTEKAVKKTTAKKTSVKKSATEVMPSLITEEQIAHRAYEIYLSRNGFGGDQVSDWFQAEQELKQE